MKTYAKILLSLLIALDLYAGIHYMFNEYEIEGYAIILLYANLILGPIQFIPALVMVFFARFRTPWMLFYLGLSIVMILLVIFFIDGLSESINNKTYFMISMCVCYVIAHFYTPIILYHDKATKFKGGNYLEPFD